MTTRTPSTTFDPDALWAKSRAFIERALRARDRQDDIEFHLWSAVSLELIGKSALARISPVLVADPNDFGSVLFACGGKEPADKKSIQAKTVFDRLIHIIHGFDMKMKEQSWRAAPKWMLPDYQRSLTGKKHASRCTRRTMAIARTGFITVTTQ